ncbi:MAG: PEP-CTERM sorting domain-containing protein [Myxococcota bacterium]
MSTDFRLSILVAALVFGLGSRAEGAAFQNLDFELAGASDDAPSLPIWAAGRESGSDPPIFGDEPFGPTVFPGRGFNGTCLGSKCLSVQDADAFPHLVPLAGDYSLLLQGGTISGGLVYIQQTGDVPADAMSIQLHAVTHDTGRLSDLRLFVDGDPLGAMVEILSRPRGSVLAADVSAYAGRTVLLRIAVQGAQAVGDESNVLIDSIEFTPVPVPEPSTVILLGLGLGWLARPALDAERRPSHSAVQFRERATLAGSRLPALHGTRPKPPRSCTS